MLATRASTTSSTVRPTLASLTFQEAGALGGVRPSSLSGVRSDHSNGLWPPAAGSVTAQCEKPSEVGKARTSNLRFRNATSSTVSPSSGSRGVRANGGAGGGPPKIQLRCVDKSSHVSGRQPSGYLESAMTYSSARTRNGGTLLSL